MSSSYASEPNPTASATLNTTIGPIHISLFANQAPLTCKNFLQHCKDNYFTGTIFHRVVPDFVIQGGDPTGTGSGGTSIYEYPEFEYDPEARDPTERVVLRDELHSRLRFNRRGRVGMAKSEDGSYGSQFFITLANTEREMNGQCTLFGRLEGDSIYNVLKIADGDRVEGTDRPMYPIKVTSCEEGTSPRRRRRRSQPRGGKVLLSFGGDEGDEEMPMRPAKPKFNTKLVSDVAGGVDEAQKHSKSQTADAPKLRKRPRSPSPKRSSSPPRKQRIKTPEPVAQLPIQDPESPDRSPSPPAKESRASRMNAEIASLKASMRRNVDTGPADTGRKKTALESMIPETAIRGRKRPPQSSNGVGQSSAPKSKAERDALQLFNSFKAKLEGADTKSSGPSHGTRKNKESALDEEDAEDAEAQLCDLHFIANCQSCKSWDDPDEAGEDANRDDEGWLTHELRFGKDTLGKDLNWKKAHPDDADSLMVIDPREKEKDLTGGRKRGMHRDRERERKKERTGELEWDRHGKR
ncbi:hypothetical protein N7532_007662 [Penicillium argentinense]|uniref:Peptidyl-prolyl isomerase CWC27 n=1 Tax=Penicillium argentinense TaxID=1131581 RepID=A0A9W9K0W7_9EURO|nr:uncharacterized protein N7532_007662 [Penicillium argentinense]KAJ5088978.1 hypothetical protein N7532_007662 [Penicillium argentinense]